MVNPPGSPQYSDPLDGLQKRVLQHLHSAKVDDQILSVVRTACDEALAAEHLVLSRAEHRRLLAQVLRSVLEGMRRQLGDESGPA